MWKHENERNDIGDQSGDPGQTHRAQAWASARKHDSSAPPGKGHHGRIADDRGGGIHEYAKLLAESREQALDGMVEQAKELGANAVVSVQLTTSVAMGGTAEILAYGTTVIIEETDEN